MFLSLNIYVAYTTLLSTVKLLFVAVKRTKYTLFCRFISVTYEVRKTVYSIHTLKNKHIQANIRKVHIQTIHI